MEVCGSLFYSVVLDEMSFGPPREYVHGYVMQRSRDGALFVNNCVSVRLSMAEVSFLNSCHDATNAFASISQWQVMKSYVDVVPEMYRNLANQRIKQSSFVLIASNTTFVLHPEAGVLPGDPFAVGMFKRAMAFAVYRFDASMRADDRLSNGLVVRVGALQLPPVQLGLLLYADDINRKTIISWSKSTVRNPVPLAGGRGGVGLWREAATYIYVSYRWLFVLFVCVCVCVLALAHRLASCLASMLSVDDQPEQRRLQR